MLPQQAGPQQHLPPPQPHYQNQQQPPVYPPLAGMPPQPPVPQLPPAAHGGAQPPYAAYGGAAQQGGLAFNPPYYGGGGGAPAGYGGAYPPPPPHAGYGGPMPPPHAGYGGPPMAPGAPQPHAGYGGQPVAPVAPVTIDVSQYKQRSELLNQLVAGIGGSRAAGSRVFEGPLAEPSTELSYRNDPVLLVDKVREVLQVIGMGALHLERDAAVHLGARRAVLPRRDNMTPLRFQFLYRVLPHGMTVTRTLTQQEPVEVFNVNGGSKVQLPINYYTATDCLRNLVAEATRGTASKNNAQYALDNIRIKPGESWQTAIGRLASVFRAAMVDADRPALSEEVYFWRTLGAEALARLSDRAIMLCCGTGSEDVATFRSFLMSRTEFNNATLRDHYPVDMYALDEPRMVARGTFNYGTFYQFAEFLGRHSIYYMRTTGGPANGSVHAIGSRRSNRLPPGHDTYSLQQRQGGVCALDSGGAADNGDDYYSDEHSETDDDAQLAAFPTGPRPATATRDHPTGGARRGGTGGTREGRRADRMYSGSRGDRPRDDRRDSRRGDDQSYRGRSDNPRYDRPTGDEHGRH